MLNKGQIVTRTMPASVSSAFAIIARSCYDISAVDFSLCLTFVLCCQCRCQCCQPLGPTIPLSVAFAHKGGPHLSPLPNCRDVSTPFAIPRTGTALPQMAPFPYPTANLTNCQCQSRPGLGCNHQTLVTTATPLILPTTWQRPPLAAALLTCSLVCAKINDKARQLSAEVLTNGQLQCPHHTPCDGQQCSCSSGQLLQVQPWVLGWIWLVWHEVFEPQ